MNNDIDTRIEDAPDRALKLRPLPGKRDDTHNEGDRDFILEVPEDFAEELIAAGWLVRPGRERPDGGHYPPSIKVTVRFDTIPPVIEHNEWSAYTVADHLRQLDDDALATMIVDTFLSRRWDGRCAARLHDAVLSYLKEPYEQK